MKWPKDIKRARMIQDILKEKVRITPLKQNPEYVAGVDAAFLNEEIIGVACLYRYPDMHLIEETYAVTETLFPYIPGLLSFREGPAIVNALKGLRKKPDIVLFDGQGIAHQRRLGIASHIGVLLNVPTIGCAKSRLVGTYKEPGLKKTSWSFLKHGGKIVGVVLRTKDNVKPIFVSPGHRIDIQRSIEIVLACSQKYRIPEPLRRADFISKKIKRELSAG
jgi:deoxyribonuclease V